MILFFFGICHAFNLLEDQLLSAKNDELENIQKYVENQRDAYLLTEEQIESQSRFITQLNADYPWLRKYPDFHDSLLTDRTYFDKWLMPTKRSKVPENIVRIVSKKPAHRPVREVWQLMNNEITELPDSSVQKLNLALVLFDFGNQTEESCPENGRSLSKGDFSNGVIDCLATVWD